MARGIAKVPEKGFAKSISTLFYVSKIFGILPYDLFSYQRDKVFIPTLVSSFFSTFCILTYAVYYHLILTNMYFTKSGTEADTLTNIIGIFIMYLELITMLVDIGSMVYHQKKFMLCIDRLAEIDEQLHKCRISLNYNSLHRLIVILIIAIIAQVLFMGVVSYATFEIGSFWWYGVYIPLFVNAFAKLWFIIFAEGIRQRFTAINLHLDDLAVIFNEKKSATFDKDVKKNHQSLWRRGGNLRRDSDLGHAANISPERSPRNRKFIPNLFVNKLIRAAADRSFNRNNKIHFIKPARPDDNNDISASPWGRDVEYVPAKSHCSRANTIRTYTPIPTVVIVDNKLDDKLSTLCFLHDDICEIGKLVNQMFTIQMLILMAYGFMAITAQLYFVYCGLVKQPIPALFRSAESLVISATFICFTGSECVYVIYKSWQTKLAAQKTGVHLHKVANVVDKDHVYQTVNHLSLKLLNHQIDFNACGFFDMDMTTIYAIFGAITSYLIILIQFNVAAQRAKMPTNTTDEFENATFPTTMISN